MQSSTESNSATVRRSRRRAGGVFFMGPNVSLPTVNPWPRCEDSARAVNHVIGAVSRRGRADVIRQHAQPRADRKGLRRERASAHDEAMLLPYALDLQTRQQAAIEIAKPAVASLQSGRQARGGKILRQRERSGIDNEHVATSRATDDFG